MVLRKFGLDVADVDGEEKGRRMLVVKGMFGFLIGRSFGFSERRRCCVPRTGC